MPAPGAKPASKWGGADKTSDFAAGRIVNGVCKTGKSFVSLLWSNRGKSESQGFPPSFFLLSGPKVAGDGENYKGLGKNYKGLGKNYKGLGKNYKGLS